MIRGSVPVARWLAVAGCLLASAPTLFSQATPAVPGRRALLIGNSRYEKLSPVPSAPLDLALLAPVLRSLNFEVTIAENLTLADFQRTVSDQWLKTIKPGDVCLLYFAGHGVQVERENYLLPVEFDPSAPDAKENIVARASLLTRLAQELEVPGPRVSLIFLDASRQEPRLATLWSNPGLVQTEDVRDTILLYTAGSSRMVSNAPAGFPSLLAQALAQALPTEGQTLAELLIQTQNLIAQKSPGEPRPYGLNQFGGTLALVAPKPVAPPPPKPEPVVTGPVFRVNKDREEYALLPSGEFRMGCVEASGVKCRPEEKPAHTVRLTRGFWIGRSEVNVDAYQQFVSATRRKMPKAPDVLEGGWQAGLPIVNVTWQEAADYCAWAGGRLPTEAEWEYAARGNNRDLAYPFGSDMSQSRDKANFLGKKGNDRYEVLAPRNRFDPNSVGLFDMAGNVWEWVADAYSETYYQQSPPVDPKGPGAGREHVARGGSWYSNADEHLRISYRQHYADKGSTVGFRCVLDDTPQTRANFR